MIHPPNPWTGTHPEAVWHNRLQDHIQSLRIIEAPGYQVRRGSKGTVLVLESQTGGGFTATPYKIVSFDADFINCHSWDGTTEGTTIVKVAKPTKLRSSIATETIDGQAVAYSLYDNVNQTRVATAGTNTETQVIVPRYLVGDVIYAMSVKTFTTDTTVKAMDMNIDGRAWASVPAGL